MASTGFFYYFFIGILITVFGLIFIEPLALFLGSTETILPYAKQYLGYILLGSPFIISSFVINNQLRFQCITFPTFCIIVMANMIMQNLGFVGRATLLSISRQGIFFIPLILTLPYIFSQTGLEATQSVADLISAICAVPLSIYVLKYLNNKQRRIN